MPPSMLFYMDLIRFFCPQKIKKHFLGRNTAILRILYAYFAVFNRTAQKLTRRRQGYAFFYSLIKRPEPEAL
jgi:hypothetical protein